MANYYSTPINQLPVGTVVKATDIYPAVDTTDHTESPVGTCKQYTVKELNNFLGSGVTVDNALLSVQMTANTGYNNSSGAGATYTLPTVSAVGDWLIITGNASSFYTIAQGPGQQIWDGSTSTTLGTGGSVTSTLHHANIYLKCIVANTIWTTLSITPSAFTFV